MDIRGVIKKTPETGSAQRLQIQLHLGINSQDLHNRYKTHIKLANLTDETFDKFETLCNKWVAGKIRGQNRNTITGQLFYVLHGLNDDQIAVQFQRLIDGSMTHPEYKEACLTMKKKPKVASDAAQYVLLCV